MILLAIAVCASIGANSVTTCHQEKIGEYATFELCRKAGERFAGAISDSGGRAASFTCRDSTDEPPIPAALVPGDR
jgi:hypothetical protein